MMHGLFIVVAIVSVAANQLGPAHQDMVGGSKQYTDVDECLSAIEGDDWQRAKGALLVEMQREHPGAEIEDIALVCAPAPGGRDV